MENGPQIAVGFRSARATGSEGGIRRGKRIGCPVAFKTPADGAVELRRPEADNLLQRSCAKIGERAIDPINGSPDRAVIEVDIALGRLGI